MKSDQQSHVWQRQVLRIYITGIIVLVVGVVAWKVVIQHSPWFDILENPAWAVGLTVISIVILPLALGGIIRYAVNPVLGKWGKWSELMSLEDRIVDELENKSTSRPEVVLIDWPSPSIQTIGILTARFPATGNLPEMAAVFHPSSPRGGSGFIRIVKVADLHFTDWSLDEIQAFHWTLGAIHPEQLVTDGKFANVI